jgi:preprotein translocase subunit SecD
MSNSEVQKVLEKKVDESVASAFDVIRKRIDKFGATQPNLQRLGNSGRILIEIPGAKDIERIMQKFISHEIDVLLTTDDRLLKKAIKYRNVLQVQLENPVTWLMNSFLLTGDDENDTD